MAWTPGRNSTPARAPAHEDWKPAAAHRHCRSRKRVAYRAVLQRPQRIDATIAAAAGAEPPFFWAAVWASAVSARSCVGTNQAASQGGGARGEKGRLRRHRLAPRPLRRNVQRWRALAGFFYGQFFPSTAVALRLWWLTARFPRLAERGTRAFRFMHHTSKDGSDAATSSKGRLQSSACDRDAARRRGHMYRSRALHSGCADALAVRKRWGSARAAPMRHFCPLLIELASIDTLGRRAASAKSP